MFSSGLRILEHQLAGVPEPRMPSLSSFCAVEKPFDEPFLDQEGGDAGFQRCSGLR